MCHQQPPYTRRKRDLPCFDGVKVVGVAIRRWWTLEGRLAEEKVAPRRQSRQIASGPGIPAVHQRDIVRGHFDAQSRDRMDGGAELQADIPHPVCFPRRNHQRGKDIEKRMVGSSSHEGGETLHYSPRSQKWNPAHICPGKPQVVEQGQQIEAMVPVPMAEDDRIWDHSALEQRREGSRPTIEHHRRTGGYEIARRRIPRSRVGPARTENGEQHA